MNLPRTRLQGIGPVPGAVPRNRGAFRRGVESEETADAVILAMQKAEHIGERSFAPVQRDLRRLQASGSSCQIAAYADGSRRLEKNTAAPWLGCELKLPAAGRDLFDAAGNSRESKWQFIVLILEIDASFIELDPLQVVHWRGRRGRPINGWPLRGSSLRRGQPPLEVPLALEVTHQNEAWPAEGQGSKLKMAAQQTRPSQARTQALRAKEIFVAECSVLANSDFLGVQFQAGEDARIKAANLDRPSKGPLEMRHKISMHAMSPRQEGDHHLQHNDGQDDGQANLPPFLEFAHAIPKFKRVSMKKVAPGAAGQPPKLLLVHRMEHPAPSRARRQVRERIEYSRQPRPKSAFPGVIAALCLDRPINQERTPHDGVVVHEAPKAAVPALIAIIPHRKILPRGHDNFVTAHEFLHFMSPFGLKTASNHLARGKVVVQRVVASGGIMNNVRLVEQLAIDIDSLVHNFHAISRQPDHALHEVLMLLIGKFENDDVATLERAVGQQFLVPAAGAAKNELVDQQMVANEQCPFHGGRGNLESLHNEGGSEQGQDYGNEE